MKYCIDCANFSHGKCERELVEREDPIWGKVSILLDNAAKRERRRAFLWKPLFGRCGPDAVFFEPKWDFTKTPPPQRGK